MGIIEQAMAEYVITILIIMGLGCVVTGCLHWLFFRHYNSIDLETDYANVPDHHLGELSLAVVTLQKAMRNGCPPETIKYLLASGEERGQKDVLLGSYLDVPADVVASCIDMCCLYGHHVSTYKVFK